MGRAKDLTSADVSTLKALAKLADGHQGLSARDDEYRKELLRLERSLSSIGRHFWFDVPSSRFRRALASFVPAFRNVKTSRGWTAYRYIRRRAEYAKRACATGLGEPLSGWTSA